MRASRPWSTEHTGNRPAGCHHGIAPQAILTQRPRAGLTMLAAAERTTDRRAEQHPSVRSQQKLAVERKKAHCVVVTVGGNYRFYTCAIPDLDKRRWILDAKR